MNRSQRASDTNSDTSTCCTTLINRDESRSHDIPDGMFPAVESAKWTAGVPVIFGVITTENMEQALDRAGGKVGNKGFEAAVTAVEMATLMKTLRDSDKAADVSAFR